MVRFRSWRSPSVFREERWDCTEKETQWNVVVENVDFILTFGKCYSG